MRIAVIGGGISGLGAAWALHRAHEVEVFEADERAGGHSHTVEHDGLALDTGFLVHNAEAYPNLVRLFAELGVTTQATEMSLAVECRACGVEYSGSRPLRSGCVREIVRWLRTAGRDAALDEVTLAEYVALRGYSDRFRRHFLLPLAAALWSTGSGRALDFPAGGAIRFFANHGMLGFRRRRWHTVTGGSRVYVGKLAERLTINTGAPVRAVRRDGGGVELTFADGRTSRHDRVVVATHADQGLALLADPSDDERRLLGAFSYTENETILHTDARFLPPRHPASWNYRLDDCRAAAGKPTVTYSLNRLQRLETVGEYLVSLNPATPVAPERVIRRLVYAHPLFTVAAGRAQRELPSLNGQRQTAYAGAYFGNGFHEDGLASGLRAAEAVVR